MKTEFVHRQQIIKAIRRRSRAAYLRNDVLPKVQESIRQLSVQLANDPTPDHSNSRIHSLIMICAAACVVIGTTFLTTFDTLRRLGWPSVLAAAIAIIPALGTACAQKWLGQKFHEAHSGHHGPAARTSWLYLAAALTMAGLDLAFNVPATIALQLVNGLEGLAWVAAAKSIGLAVFGFLANLIVFFQAGEAAAAERVTSLKRAIAREAKKRQAVALEVRQLDEGAELLELDALGVADQMNQGSSQDVTYSVWRPRNWPSQDGTLPSGSGHLLEAEPSPSQAMAPSDRGEGPAQ
jgi:hypothetical protein